MPEQPNRLSVVAGALGDDARASVRRARELAFEGIAFDSITGPLDLTTLSGTGVREFRHLLAVHELQLVALRSAAGSGGIGVKADLDRVLARLDAVMRTATALGTPLVCFDCGRLPPAPQLAAPRPAITPEQAGAIIIPEAAPAPPPAPPVAPPDPAETAAVATALAAICQVADRYNCTLALRSDLSDFAALHHAIAQARCPWLGVDLDTAAVLIDPWSVDEIFARLGPLVRQVRARDALRGSGERTTPAPLGQGNVPWAALLANLSGADYAGFVTIDPVDLPARAAAAEAGREFLSALR